MFKVILCSVLFLLIIENNASPVDLGIVGGQDADIADHPWQVSLLRAPAYFFCGGSLIADQWVLTAAHCGFAYDHIRAGSINVDQGGIFAEVDKIIRHPNFEPAVTNGSTEYDIALVHLANPINGTNIRPINLPAEDDEIPDDEFFNATGWGSTGPHDDTIPPLQVVALPTLNIELCKLAYENSLFPNVTDKMFCAGFEGLGGKSPCYGDSGGPAAYNGKVHGIIAWGFECGDARYPAVFTKVSSYLEWIYEVTGIEKS